MSSMNNRDGKKIARKTLNNFIIVCCKHGYIDPRVVHYKVLNEYFFNFKRTLVIPGIDVDKNYRVDIKVPCRSPYGSLDIDLKSLRETSNIGCVLELRNSCGYPGWLFSSACSHIAFAYENDFNFLLVSTDDLRDLIRSKKIILDEINNVRFPPPPEVDEYVVKYSLYNRPNVGRKYYSKGQDVITYADWSDIKSLPSCRVWNLDKIEEF